MSLLFVFHEVVDDKNVPFTLLYHFFTLFSMKFLQNVRIKLILTQCKSARTLPLWGFDDFLALIFRYWHFQKVRLESAVRATDDFYIL